MRKIHLTLSLTIDDKDRVTVDQLQYEVRGKHDAPLSEATVTPADVVTIQEPTKQEPNLSEPQRNEVLALLLSLGFDVGEGQQIVTSRTASRIREVVKWVRTRNGVANPKKLAAKLFEQA